MCTAQSFFKGPYGPFYFSFWKNRLNKKETERAKTEQTKHKTATNQAIELFPLYIKHASPYYLGPWRDG
ncbi:TPA: hypothetical protein I7726_16135 [Vibrio vulnificus]|nr:hypothetical protein [Vibrio vulnificus]